MSLMKFFLALLQDNAKNPALWSLSQVVISCCLIRPTLLNPFARPHLAVLPPPLPVSLPFVPVWIFQIAAAAGAWCWGLSAHCVYAVWVLRYATPWRVVCRDRRVATDASRPPACLPVQLHLTAGDIAISTHTHRNTCRYTQTHIHCSTRHGAQNLN